MCVCATIGEALLTHPAGVRSHRDLVVCFAELRKVCFLQHCRSLGSTSWLENHAASTREKNKISPGRLARGKKQKVFGWLLGRVRIRMCDERDREPQEDREGLKVEIQMQQQEGESLKPSEKVPMQLDEPL